MNGEQQRQHTTVTAELRRDLVSLSEQTANEALELRGRVDTTQADLTRHVGNLTRAISDLRDEHAGTQDRLLSTKVEVFTFTHRGLWARLNWLLTGR
jgi:hypothetical protein